MGDDGYPTDEELDSFATFTGTPRGIIELATSLWNYPAAVKVEDASDDLGRAVKRVEMVTLGWSGNESVAGALSRTLFHYLWWSSSHKGGLAVYEVPADQWEQSWELGLPSAVEPEVVGWLVLQEHPDWSKPKRMFSQLETDRAKAVEFFESISSRPEPHGVTYRLASVHAAPRVGGAPDA